MPSTNKTPNYGLNLWAGNDRPIRADFNKDNEIIDEKIKVLSDKVDQPKYDVGSLYWNATDPTSPAIKFGGVWAQIKDVFLLAAGDVYAAGTTGGSATQTITVQQMPPHKHKITVQSDGGIVPGNIQWGSPTGNTVAFNSTEGQGAETSGGNDGLSWPAGNGQPFNIMPPYKAVYCWERTA